MVVHPDQPGDYRVPGAVLLLRVRRNRDRSKVADGLNLSIDDYDALVLDSRAACAIDDAHMVQYHNRRMHADERSYIFGGSTLRDGRNRKC